MTVVGFDFGTTNSSISVIVGDRAIDIVDTEDGLPFPSVVRYEGEKTIVGRQAKALLDVAGIGVHGNTVLSPKSLLGEESVHVGGVERSPVDIVRDVVLFVKSEALRSPRAADLDGVSSAVVTIPIGMNGRRRAALRDAFRRADIGIAQFVHEPFAALYGYFRSQGDVAAALREYDRRNVLVVDWGGGTLDLTLCRIERGRILQRVNGGSDDVGGDRFDETIRDEVVRKFSREAGIRPDAEIHPDARIRLLHDSEENKIALSTRRSVTFFRQGFFTNPDTTLECRLTREELEEFTKPLVQQGMRRIEALLESAGVGTSQIALCLVTGGMAGMPAIIGRVHELLGPQRVKVPADSETMIAQGAAWVAHDRRRLELGRAIELQLARSAYLPLIPAGTQMPSEREEKERQFHLYCVDPRDGAAKFQLCSPQRLGEDVQSSDPRTTLGTLVVSVDKRALPFRERLELSLRLDDDMILHAKAWSSDVKDVDEAEFHELEFAISVPGGSSPPPPGSGDGQGSRRSVNPERVDGGDPEDVDEDRHQPGDLVARSNIAVEKDDYFVPGELLYTYNPVYFNVGLNPPRIQVEERLYYEPCAVCGRASSDPACRCASGGTGRQAS